MWNVFGRILKSDLYYFVGRSMKLNGFLHRAYAVDHLNFRAADRLSKVGIDHEPMLAFSYRMLIACNSGIGQGTEARAFYDAVLTRDGSSHSQLFQDLFVVLATAAKRGGYFVEIGVGDGISLSNTAMLEQRYGWTGILAEPNPNFHAAISSNRLAILDKRAVFSRSGDKLDFRCDKIGELSGIVDTHARTKQQLGDEVIPVETVSLNDLLDQHRAPAVIDYMSIDTEGSELDIITPLDFARHRPMILTIEHNGDADKVVKLKSLLEPKGYRHVLEQFSQIDAWFVDRSISFGQSPK
jgi:FkbM family methyltransferase